MVLNGFGVVNRCGHCKKMAAGYQKAAEDLAKIDGNKAVVAELDCNEAENKPLMSKYYFQQQNYNISCVDSTFVSSMLLQK